MNRVLILALVASAAAGGYLLADPPVNLQASSPGTQQTGNTNVSGTMIAGKVSATNSGATAQVIVGDATSATGTNYGGLFKTASSSGTAVRGVASALAGATNGGTFQAAAPSGAGARGFHVATTGLGFGLFGQTASTSGKGVAGSSTALTGDGIGVFGSAASPTGFAGYFDGRARVTGMLLVGSHVGVNGDLSALGISGSGSNITNLNASNIGSGTLSDAHLSANVARRDLSNLFLGSQEVRSLGAFFKLVHGTTLKSLVRGGDRSGFGGFLYVQDPNGSTQVGMDVDTGNVGTVFADTKNFRVPNPEDPKTDIWYACVEGPEAAAYLRGTARLENGRAFVQFPQHFKSVAVSKGMTVQLTARSVDTYGLAVLESSVDGISVGELQRGKGNFEFDWEVKAVRKGHENYEVIRPWDNIVTADEDKKQAWANRLKSIEDRKNRERANQPPKG